MKVELLLDPQSPAYRDLLDGMEEELAALRGLTHERETAPAPARTLSVEHDILKLVFEHPDVVVLVTTLIQLATAVIERIGKKEAQTVIVVGGHPPLHLPASTQSIKRFVAQLKGRKRARKATTTRKVGQAKRSARKDAKTPEVRK